LLSTLFTRLSTPEGYLSLDIISSHLSALPGDTPCLYLIGYAADFGAMNADSRTGAEKAPSFLREQFFTQITQKPLDPNVRRLWDLGDIDANRYYSEEEVM